MHTRECTRTHAHSTNLSVDWSVRSFRTELGSPISPSRQTQIQTSKRHPKHTHIQNTHAHRHTHRHRRTHTSLLNSFLSGHSLQSSAAPSHPTHTHTHNLSFALRSIRSFRTELGSSISTPNANSSIRSDTHTHTHTHTHIHTHTHTHTHTHNTPLCRIAVYQVIPHRARQLHLHTQRILIHQQRHVSEARHCDVIEGVVGLQGDW
jgi:hypothetical protein